MILNRQFPSTTAVFRFLTNIIAVFRFCRLLRFAEMDVFLTRFSDLSHIYCGFSVFEKYAFFGNSPPYCGSRFADIRSLIAARGLLVLPVRWQRTIKEACANEQSISFYTFD